MTNQNANSYPFWFPPSVQRAYTLGAQDARRVQTNSQIPLQDEAVHDDIPVVMSPQIFQDSRRAGDADKQAVGVGDPGYLFQRFYESPALTGKQEE